MIRRYCRKEEEDHRFPAGRQGSAGGLGCDHESLPFKTIDAGLLLRFLR